MQGLIYSDVNQITQDELIKACDRRIKFQLTKLKTTNYYLNIAIVFFSDMSIVSTKEAASLLGVSQTRVRWLAANGRIKNARKIGNSWIIPLFDGMPIISKGLRGPKPKWKTSRQRNRPTVIHVFKKNIGKKDDRGCYLPAIAVKDSPQGDYSAYAVAVEGSCTIVYQPDRPFRSGAKVWIETACEVRPLPSILMATS